MLKLSKENKEERRTITVGELVSRANQLRDYISAVGSQIENISAQLVELQTALDTLNSIPKNGFPGLIALDRLKTAFIQVKTSNSWFNEVLVNIGRSYYIKTSVNEAIEIISKRVNTLRKTINELRRRYQVALNEYNAIQQILANVYARIEQQRSKETRGS
ncbi:MAG: prefoldin subunit alpha [Thermoprotei archaeon]|nr:MAG: prefoldin subunit alpha [Thermoprotei archaeon]